MGLTSTRKQAILELVTKLKTDDPSVIDRLAARYNALGTQANSAQDRLRLLTGGLKETEVASAKAISKALDHARALNEVGKEADKTKNKLNFYQQAVRDSYKNQGSFLKGGTPSVGGGSPRGGNASSALSALGSVLPGQGGEVARSLGNLSRLTEQISKFSSETGIAVSSIGKATPALAGLNTGIAGLAAGGIAAVALAALAIALDQFVKGLQEAQDNLSNAYDAQVEYYRLIQTGTSEEIQAKIDAIKIDIQSRELANRDLIDAAKRATAALGPFAKIVLTIAEGLGIGPYKEINESNKEISKSTLQLNALTEALKSPEVKARDLAEAARKAADEQSKQAKETDKASNAADKAAVSQSELAESVNQLAILYENINAHQKSTADSLRQAEFNLAQERQRIFADYAERISDQERQDARERAREARRAAYDKARAEIEGRDEAFDLALERDFAGLARLNRQEERDTALQRLDDEFQANEKLIAQREQDFDDQLALQRQLAELNRRVSTERAQAAQSELEFMRQQVAEFFRLKGYLGDVSRFTNDQIARFYKLVAQTAGVPQTTFGAPLGGSLGGSVPTVAAPTSGSGFGAAFGGRTPTFGATGGYSSTVNAGGVNININGAQNPQAVAREVQQAIDAYFRGINR